MKRWCATLLVFAVSSALVHADVTIVQKTTMEGAMMANAPGGAPPSPTMTIKIKGLKSRTEMEVSSAPVPLSISALTGRNISTITDLAAKQVILLMHDQKVAQVMTAPVAGATTAAAAADAARAKVDARVTRSGKSQVIDGFKCDEYTFTSSNSMAETGGANAPPEVAAMTKGIVMKISSSMWITKDVPGSAEYRAFQKAMVESQLGLRGAGGLLPILDRMMKAMTGVDGVAYLTEIDITMEGTGEMADTMSKKGAMRITTRVTSITTDPLSDDLFTIPAGYTKR